MKKTFYFIGLIPAVFLAQEKKDSVKVTEIKEVSIIKKQPVAQTLKGYQLNVSGTMLEQKENVSEIIKFSPNISYSNGLKILGSDKIQIILNKKEVKISPDQFDTFLSSLDAKTIKNIEINDAPDASMDSRYTAQIIITTKKVEGQVLGLGTGVYYNDKFGYNSNANYMATFGKLRVYASGDYFIKYSDVKGNSLQKWTDQLTREGEYGGKTKRFGNNATFNLDYDFNDKHKLSFLYNYTADMDLDKNYIYHYKTQTLSSSGSSFINNFSETKDKTHTFSLQYDFSSDKDDELTINADYALEKFYNPFRSYNDFYTNGLFLNSENYTQNGRLDYKIFTASADYTKKINEQNKLSFGVKFSNSDNRNTADYYSFDTFIDSRSQNFYFNENIYSAYLNYSLSKGKLKYNLGLRNEYTDADFQTNKGLDSRVNYNKFLPSATVTYTHDKNHTFYLHASKRFTRPSFFSYDPTIMVEQTDVWSSGNQHLKPMDYFISQAGYVLMKKYSFVFRYLYSENNIINVSNLLNSGVLFSKLENAGYQNTFLFNVNIPIKIADFWNTTNKINLSHSSFKAGQYNLSTQSYYATLESIHSFDLFKKVKLDVSVNYSTPSRQKFNYNYSNFYTDLNLRIPLFENKANLTLNISDVFNTNRAKEYSDINGIYTYNYTKNNSRGISIKFSYQFQTGKKFDNEIRDTSIDDLLNRTGK